MQTSIHGAISGTPSLQQLLEERTLSTQTVVTCVGFRESFYTILETTMPMFGSTSRGKSGMASAPEKEDAAASKGVKSKEDADRGATCSNPHHNKSTSREMSPQRSPSNLGTRECFAVLFGVEVTPTIEDGVRLHILPTYAWTEHIIFDILSPTIEDISQVMILNPMECLVFRGHPQGAKDSHMVRPWHCPTSITEKQLPGLATESRYTASCAPYEMPEEILEWSGTRNMIRPSSTYSTSTRRMKRMANPHQTVEEGMCTVQITILLRGSSRNNQNKGQKDARQMRETTAAKAQNKVMRAGMYSLAETDLRVCMLIMRPWRGPHEGIPYGEVIPKESRRNSTTLSIRPKRTSLIWHWV